MNGHWMSLLVRIRAKQQFTCGDCIRKYRVSLVVLFVLSPLAFLNLVISFRFKSYHSKMLDWRRGSRQSYKQINESPEAVSNASLWQDSQKWKISIEARYLYWCIIGLQLFALIFLLFDKRQTSNHMKFWGSYEKGFATDFGELNYA